LVNNVLWTDAGPCIAVDAGSQTRFSSDYNLFWNTATGKIGQWQGIDRPTLASWRSATLGDGGSLSQDPLFVDAAQGDFHERSVYGSYHGGSLAPALGLSGLPVSVAGTWVADAAGSFPPGVDRSPAIDRGSAALAFANEPAPSGGFINIGAYGNTAQASKSPAAYALVTSPDGGETLPQRRSFSIRWRSESLGTGTVRLEVYRTGNASPAAAIADATPNDGEFTWTVPDSLTAASDYLVRVTRTDGAGTSDTSNAPFTFSLPINIYYVNDSTVTGGDWTTAAGNDANDGLSPATPKASLSVLLATYDLGPGDIVRVDRGTYALTTNIQLAPDDSGVTLEGFVDSADGSRKTVLNRGNTASGTAVFQFTGADDVTIRGFGITGAQTGVSIAGDVDSDRVTVTGNEVFQNSANGISVSSSNRTTSESLVVSNNDVWGNQNYGIYTWNLPTSGQAVVTGNRVYANGSGTGIYGYGGVLVTSNTTWGQGTGISVDSGAVIRNNVAFDNSTGISSSNGGTIDGNRVYRNTTGIYSQSSAVTGNTVYANSTGISLYWWRNTGTPMSNNLVYANTNAGITLSGVFADGSYSIANNTIYQPVGTAVNVTGSSNVRLVNNILWTDAGPCIAVDASSQTGFSSDYNLFWNTATGKIGQWAGTLQASLAAWRTASGQDTRSVFGIPQFVDVDGADNVLGYSATGTGYDGGRDDNFSLFRGSPAIDAGTSSLAPVADMFGNARVDDAGTVNTGGGITDIGAIEFLGSSLDTTPPTISATFPSQIASSGAYGLTRRIDVTFSEGVNVLDGLARGNYELVKAGSSGFGSPNDVYYTLTPSALTTVATGIRAVRLDLGLAGASLPNGQYRLTVRGAASRAIHDSAGNTLDGNADGTAGGDWVRTFTVDQSITVPVDVPAGQTSTDDTTRTGSYQLVKQGGGTLILDKPNTHSGGTVVEAGRVIVKNASALGTGLVRIKAGATLVIDPAAGEALAGSLVIDDGGFVDLGTGRLLIASGMTASDLVNALLLAKGDGTWTGTSGLGSSAVASSIARFETRSVGWIDNGDGSFTVGFAAPGDTSLDGVVDITDVANFLSSGKLDSGDHATWDTGDFNLDGVVDQLDLADFLGTSLYDAGPYIPSQSGMTVEPSAASQAAASVGSGSSESAAIQSAFAALATEAATSTRDKRKVFATYR
jgi:autotransporter-associated beta strand protein